MCKVYTPYGSVRALLAITGGKKMMDMFQVAGLLIHPDHGKGHSSALFLIDKIICNFGCAVSDLKGYFYF